jgi:hypothetical protein
LETAHNQEEDPNQPETAANALAHGTKIQLINTQQATAVQSNHQTHMDLQHTTLGMYQTIQLTNHTACAIKNTLYDLRCAMVRE